MSSGLGAVVTYVVLACLWGAALVLYARQWRAAKGERLIRVLLVVLMADAVKTVLESAYFGLLWGSNYGLLPPSFQVLGKPVFLTSVKWMTVGLAVAVLAGIIRFWVPKELQLRREQREGEKKLREQLEASLRDVQEREERFTLAALASRDGLWDQDLRTGTLYISPRSWELLGYAGSPTTNVAEAWLHLVHPEDRDALSAAYERFLTSGEARYETRFRALHRDGRVLHFQSRALLVRDTEGKPIRMVGFTRDVSDDLAAEENRVQTQKLESLGLLAGGIAHDFNNLLTVVSSSLSLAERQVQANLSVDEALHTAGLAVQRATVLTRQLLAYAGRTTLSQHPLDLNQVVQSIGELLSVSMPRKVSLALELSPTLPAVMGDDGQLQQVVMNLITNAAEAIGEDEGTVTLRTEETVLKAVPPGARSAVPLGHVVRLTVRDTGAGIAPEVLERIFDPFFTTKGTGRGLGLAALLGILRKHGAGITVESEPGRGTTFTILLPALGVPAPALTPPALIADTSKLTARVLLVDDEPLLRRSAARLLTLLGCVVDEAATGAEAVAKVTATPQGFDVVLMDLTMPEMDGFEATRRIAQLAPQLPVVVSSGYTSVELPAQLPPGTRSLAKPYDVNRLEAVLREVTNGHAG